MTNDIFANYLKAAKRETLNEGVGSQINEDLDLGHADEILEFVSAVFESTARTKFRGHGSAKYVTAILYDDFSELFMKNPTGFDFHKFRNDNDMWANSLPNAKLKQFMEDYDFRIIAGDLLIGAGTPVKDMLYKGDFLATMTRLALNEIADICLQSLESMLEFEGMMNRNGLLISENTKSPYKTIYYEGASNASYVRFAFVDATGAKTGVTFDKYMASTLPERKIEGGGPLPTPEEAKAKIIKNIMKAGYITQMNRRMEANDIVKKNTNDLDKTLKLLLDKSYIKNITAKGFKIPH